jgi:hypothetical protein
MNGVLTFTQWTKSIRLNENVRDAKKYLIKRYVEDHNIDNITPEVEQKAVNNKAYNRIREILKGADGYVYTFVKFHFDHDVDFANLAELYTKIKENAGSLNSLPMTIDEYSNQELVNGVNPFEALMDQFHNIESRRKHKWIIEKVNGDLRRSIKQLPPAELDRLYKAAQLIDEADEAAGDFTDPESGNTTNNRISLLRKSNAFKEADKYLVWVEEIADGVSNSDVSSKINALRSLQPEAGIIYNRNGYLALSIRTEHAQKELCSVANWCINRGSWSGYGGKQNAIQINIFNFNEPVTNPMHIAGTTITDNKVSNSHDKNDDPILKSSNPADHFTRLGYPEDLVKIVVDSIPKETLIKKIVTGLGIDTSNPAELLTSLVKSSYKINLDVETDIRNVIIGIIRDQLSKKLSRSNILEVFSKNGILSTFSARVLNVIIPDLTDSEKADLLNSNDKLLNDPTTGIKLIVASVGRARFPQLTTAIDSEEQIKNIITSGESISTEE